MSPCPCTNTFLAVLNTPMPIFYGPFGSVSMPIFVGLFGSAMGFMATQRVPYAYIEAFLVVQNVTMAIVHLQQKSYQFKQT